MYNPKELREHNKYTRSKGRKKYIIQKQDDIYFDMLCQIAEDQYGVTKQDVRTGRGGKGWMAAKMKTIITTILKDDIGYGISKQARIMQSDHSIIHSFIKRHKRYLGTFGYKEMYLDVLSRFVTKMNALPKNLPCHPCYIETIAPCKP